MGKDAFGLFLIFFLTTTLLCASIATKTTQANSCAESNTASPAPAPSPIAADIDPATSFVISACAYHTLYPRLCSRTLAPYASAVGSSPRRLAYAAVDAAVQRASDSAALVSRLYGRERPTDDIDGSTAILLADSSSSSTPQQHTYAGPLRDCTETMSDSVDRLRMSAREMRRMGIPFSAGKDIDDEFESRLSNVQTWVSAALTDQTTCLDGFDEGQGPGHDSTTPPGSAAAAAARRKADSDPVAAAVRKSVLHVSHMTSNALALINRIGPTGPQP